MLMGGIFAGLPCQKLQKHTKNYKKDCRGHCKCQKAELNVLLHVLVEDHVETKHASI